jgi:hypothetical protein
MEIKPENSECLSFLHDAIVKRLDFACTSLGVQAIVLELLVTSASGMPEWDGRTCVLKFQNPWFLTGDFVLIYDSWDQVNSINFTDASIFAEKVQRGAAMGLPEPQLYLAICFTGGSVFNICCDRLEIETCFSDKRTN